ncbi:MAG TPA: hypothetical protein VGQ69_00745 [Gemmatimonadales bacterium]|jgi:hypothetical protein|nr:hypothetical protein [Gemmatimonadales bacterium]
MRGLAKLGLGAASLVAACGGGGEAKPGSAVTRDSAGIRIVENSGPAWGAGKGWTVVDSPLVDIGGRDEPAYELEQVRGPIQLGDGRLALANAASNEIRLYDATGKHLRTAGRAGSGPGEYRGIAGIWPGAGDSLLVADIMLRRITVLDAEGNTGREYSLGGQPSQFVPMGGRIELAIPLGMFTDGSVVGVSQSVVINQARPGVYRDSVNVIRYGPDGAVRDTLGRFPGLEMESMTITMGPGSLAMPIAVPLGKQTMIATRDNHLFVAQNNQWEIEIRGTDGALRTLARAPVTPAKLTPSDIAAHRKELLGSMEAQPLMRGLPAALKSQMTARVEQAKYPETLPYFGALLTDAEGDVWAQEAAAPTRKAGRFFVVDSTGRWLGTVTMPERFQPTFVGTDAVYGIWKDEADVEHVRGYRLSKP